ncbi:minor capsid protein [Microbacterium phage ValentiniPuff]|uniref:Minor capsid protein n=1 Tax=Microbacterium phage ValentiniPuff TaxID=2315705 RepID=A0A386KPJ3_9CAUD|nr:minor capsid protein [Microbacterium phage ValentiniPuff]
MPVDAPVRALMVHEFIWKKKTGQDVAQQPTFTEQPPIMGLHDEGTHTVEDQNGNKRTAQGTAYLEDVFPIDPADELWYCGRSLGEIVRVEQWPDPRSGGGYATVVHHG